MYILCNDRKQAGTRAQVASNSEQAWTLGKATLRNCNKKRQLVVILDSIYSSPA